MGELAKNNHPCLGLSLSPADCPFPKPVAVGIDCIGDLRHVG